MTGSNRQNTTGPEPAVSKSCGRDDEILVIKNLGLELGGKEILTGIEFSLPRSGITTLIGPSGAGKSSILRCVNRLIDNWTGDITFYGKSLREKKTDVDSLRKKIGLISQKPLMFHCSILQNLVFGLPRKKRNRIKNEEVMSLLQRVGLSDELDGRLSHRAVNLSIGQQQRLSIARALMVEPEILLLDEPTSSLDPLSKEIVEKSLLSLAEDMPLLVVTHDMEQAKRLGGHLVFICDGKIVEQRESAEFFSSPQKLESREFLRWNVCDCS